MLNTSSRPEIFFSRSKGELFMFGDGSTRYKARGIFIWKGQLNVRVDWDAIETISSRR